MSARHMSAVIASLALGLAFVASPVAAQGRLRRAHQIRRRAVVQRPVDHRRLRADRPLGVDLCSGEAIHCPVESGVAVLVFPCMVNESWRTGRMMAWDAERKETVSADTVPLDPFPGEMPKPSCIQLTKSDRC